MNFSEAEAYLYSLGNEVSTMKLGLASMQTLLRDLGDPARKIRKVQVAGTNGKGSVCAFLDSICRSAGTKSGLYTSPHLISVTERIRINGQPIGEKEFARIATFVRKQSERLVERGELDVVPTFFEQVTAIALMAFDEAGVQLAILETGLGGRLDATTAANAEIAGICRIDYDHQEYLGSTLADIAAEKAAIIHQGSVVVVGPQEPEAMTVIYDACRKYSVSPQFAEDAVLPTQHLGLGGRHQVENAKIAMALAGQLRTWVEFSDDAIVTGLENARHPGRLEYQGRFLFDGAHNVGGARVLAEYIDEFERRPITMLFGCMRGKEVRRIAEALFPLGASVILTQPDNTRALPVAELEEIAAELNVRAESEPSVARAIALALARNRSDGIILVTGSLYLVGEVKRLLNN